MAYEGGDRSIERRETVRAAVEGTVVMRADETSDYVMHSVTNISTGGMFIRTPEVRPVGTRLGVRLIIAGSESVIEGTAEVVWVRTIDQFQEGPPGMAVRFVDMDQATRLQIALLVQERAEKGTTVASLSEPPMPLGVAEEPFGMEGGDPEERGKAIPAFDVFPAPSDDEEATASNVPDIILGDGKAYELSGDAPHRSFPGPGLIVLVVAVAVVAIGIVGYLASGHRLSLAGLGSGTHEVAATAQTTHASSRPGSRQVVAGEGDEAEKKPVRSPIPAGTAGAVEGTLTRRGKTAGVGAPEPSPTSTPLKAALLKSSVGAPATVAGSANVKSATSTTPRGHRRNDVRRTVAHRLKGIEIKRQSSVTRVTLSFDGQMDRSRIRSFPMTRPPRFVLQLRGITADDPYATLDATTPTLKSIRLGLHAERRPQFLQVVLDLRDSRNVASPSLDGDTLVVQIRPRPDHS